MNENDSRMDGNHVPPSEGRQLALGSRLGKIPPAGSPPPQIVPALIPHGSAALAPSQEQIWRRSMRVPQDSALYNETITIRRFGPVDISLFEACLAEIIRRHESWRTTFSVVGDHPVQVVHPAPLETRIPSQDLTRLPPDRREEHLSRLISEQARVPFDLCKGPLLRASAFTMGENDVRLSILAHQSIVDGISAYQIFPSEFAALFAAFCRGRSSPLPHLSIQYCDFSVWQRRRLQTELRKPQLDYWKKQLSRPLPPVGWPGNRSAAAGEEFQGATLPFAVPPDLSKIVTKLSRDERVSTFMVLLAGFAALLRAYTRQVDLIIATLSPSGRKLPETEPLLGYFLNPVALRFDFSRNPTFTELLAQTRTTLADAISNDDIPLEVLANELRLDSHRDPFVKVAISLQPRPASLGPDWQVTTMDDCHAASPWDFYLAFIERGSGLIGRVQYNPDFFAQSDVARVLRDLWRVLEIAGSNPGAPVTDTSPS